MKIKAKSLQEKEIDNYIREHNGRLTNNEALLAYANAPEKKGYFHYYEFDDSRLLLVMQQLGGRVATLYEDKDIYISNMLKIREWNRRTPLDKHQEIIQNLPQHIEPLIGELYLKLKLDINAPVRDFDLEKLDKAIKKYGYEKSYEDLFLHLIVFAGEYAKAKVGGSWIIEKSDKNELVPFFLNGRNESLRFGFWIEKDFKKTGRFSMNVIIMAALHGTLMVHPNSSLRNLNE